MTVIDTLRGTRNTTVERFGLERYPRFGELRDIDRSELSRIADALIQDRLLESSATLRPTIRITSVGRNAISHLTLRKFAPEPQEAESSRNPDLLIGLRELRDRIAARDGDAAPSICSDTLLVRFSNDLPTTRNSFMAVDGADEDLYNRCGASIIALIESTLNKDQPKAERSGGSTIPERLRRTHSLLEEGCGLQEIAQRSALQPSTVSGHIEDLLKLGVKIEIDRFVPAGILRAVREQLLGMPNASLRELRALLGGSVEYPELRVAAAWVRFGTGTIVKGMKRTKKVDKLGE
jgi:ATP-dependent DNA helicase RecQ